MSNLLVLPVVLPLIAGAVLIVLPLKDVYKRWVTGLTSGLILVSVAVMTEWVARDGVQVLELGGWVPPFGIVFVIDWLSILMLIFLNIIGFSCIVYSFFKRIGGRQETPYFDSLVLFQLAGVNGVLLTGDMFNLFVWYEVMLIASFSLLAQAADRERIKGIPDYVVINMISSALFVISIGLLYATYGTLNMAHIAQLVEQGHAPPWNSLLAFLFFVVFGTKSALFPLYFWIFRSYPLASATVAGLLGGLLTKVGVFSMLRVYPLLFPGEFIEGELSLIRLLFYVVGGLSIVIGGVGAVSRSEWKDILSHHITSQIGYMIVGIAIWTPMAMAATIFYVLQNTIVKSSLFLIGGMTEDHVGSTKLDRQSGLLFGLPGVAFLFLTAAFALSGLPPFSGFFAKLTLFSSMVQVGTLWPYLALIAGVIGGFFTLYSMVKIWRYGFMGSYEEEADRLRRSEGPISPGLYVGPGILVAGAVIVGLWAGPLFELTAEAGEQLIEPRPYVDAVLEESPVHRAEPGEVQVDEHVDSYEPVIVP